MKSCGREKKGAIEDESAISKEPASLSQHGAAPRPAFLFLSRSRHVPLLSLTHRPYKNENKQVVCTLGPKSRSVEVLEELLRAGMSVARFNFSHGSHEYHQVTRIFFFSLFLSER